LSKKGNAVTGTLEHTEYGGSANTDSAAKGHEDFSAAVTVDGREIRLNFRDPIVDARKLLREAELEPPDEFVLVELQRPGTRSIGLDEEVDLREPGRENFHAFRSDRLFTFTVDQRGYEWGAATITGAELRDIASVTRDVDLVLEHEDEPDEVIRNNDEVDLTDRGAERIRTRARPEGFKVVVIYNGQRKPLEVANAQTISDVLVRAIALFGSLPNPHTLSLFTEDKGELKDEWTVREAGLTPHEEVLLRPSTVKAG